MIWVLWWTAVVVFVVAAVKVGLSLRKGDRVLKDWNAAIGRLDFAECHICEGEYDRLSKSRKPWMRVQMAAVVVMLMSSVVNVSLHA